MTPEFQFLFNTAVTLAGVFAGWVLKSVTNSLRELQNADKDLADRVNDLQVSVVGGYVNRTEFSKSMDALFETLRRIEDKLDRKVDKE